MMCCIARSTSVGAPSLHSKSTLALHVHARLHQAPRAAAAARITRTRPPVISAAADGASTADAGADARIDNNPRLTPEMKQLLHEAQAFKPRYDGNNTQDMIRISDLVSKEDDGKDTDGELQWVQVVMAGGGMLGIAHVGFVSMLEEGGVRFLGVGGTSAGAINAALIAGVRGKLQAPSWPETLEALYKCDFASFEDGDPVFKELREDLTAKHRRFMSAFGRCLAHPWALINVLTNTLGLHKGDAFLKWMHDQMKETSQEMLEHMQLVDESGNKRVQVLQRKAVDELGNESLAEREDVTNTLHEKMQKRENFPLKLVASEIKTQTMIVFPQDADLCYADPGGADPAEFVRASMSIPGFFYPFKLPFISPIDRQSHGWWTTPEERKVKAADWKERNDFGGDLDDPELPTEVFFCDGGTLSNFPMSLFHKNETPLLPTVGVQLGGDRRKAIKIKGPIDMVHAMNNASRHLSDRSFLHNNSAYKGLLATIDTSEFKWLDFNMSEGDKKKLLLAGMVAGKQYLEKWQLKRRIPVELGEDGQVTQPMIMWEAYKHKRAAISALPKLSTVEAEAGSQAQSKAVSGVAAR